MNLTYFKHIFFINVHLDFEVIVMNGMLIKPESAPGYDLIGHSRILMAMAQLATSV